MQNNMLKRHWRIIIPIIITAVIFCFSAQSTDASDSFSAPIANFFGLPHAVIRKTTHFVLFGLLGASWYYYLRKLSSFTPGFTSLGSLSFVLLYAVLDEYHQTLIPSRSGELGNILLDTTAGLAGITLIALVYYLTRSKKEKIARRKQVDKIWSDNDKLTKSLKKPHKK